MKTDNEELQQALIRYLQLVNNKESMNLLRLMTAPQSTEYTAQSKGYSNSTRPRRDTDWDEDNEVYTQVSQLSNRQGDVRRYGNHKSYIWGKYFGVPKGNLQVAAGGFIGANSDREYKVFARAKAVGHAFGINKLQLIFSSFVRSIAQMLPPDSMQKSLERLFSISMTILCVRASANHYIIQRNILSLSSNILFPSMGALLQLVLVVM